MYDSYRDASRRYEFEVDTRAAKLIEKGVAPWVAIFQAAKEIQDQKRRKHT